LVETVVSEASSHVKVPQTRLTYRRCGKAHAHGGNVHAVTAPDGFPLRVSEVEPGSVHDITAARVHALPALYWASLASC
jgi:hypothetical protein